METVLSRIGAYKAEEVASRKDARPLELLSQTARAAPTPRGFADALLAGARGGGYGLIGEIKKASPSAGLIRADFDPPTLARAYEEGGASCLSVLTDGPSFQGEDAFLEAAREATALPVLRKDFMIDPYQIAESRALGADCVLIIMALVSDPQAAELEAAATEWGMDTLVEVHDQSELERAARLSSRLIGVNNRDLATMRTDLATSRELARRVPEDRLIVAESGFSTPADLADLARFGVRCFLVGESLMREDDVAEATRRLLGPVPAENP